MWHFLDTEFNNGKFNMDFDIELAGKCSDGEAYFRLYQWEPYCISLGANQNDSDLNLTKCRHDNIDVVTRPTGGRAILHAEEITYSVVIPAAFGLSVKDIYSKISMALAGGLGLYEPALKEVDLETFQPDFPSLLNKPEGKLCFSSTAKSEVKYDGRKLIGSAQRKMEKAILQHGSILCGRFHENLADYLVDQSNIKFYKDELKTKTITIEDILGEPVDYIRLKDCLKQGFESFWSMNFTNTNINYSTANEIIF
ncbi:MAG: hypothetical protein ABIG69_11375 [Bacteroidota bacterium]